MKWLMKRSRKVAKLFLLLSIPIAVTLGVRAIASAQLNLKIWSKGEQLSSKDFNANFAALQAAIPSAVPGYEMVSATQAQEAVPAGSDFPDRSWSVACPAGKKILSGGCAIENGEWHLYGSAPTGNPPTGWVCRAECMGNAKPTGGTSATNFVAYAICATIP